MPLNYGLSLTLQDSGSPETKLDSAGFASTLVDTLLMED